jgi:hypothetical protein
MQPPHTARSRKKEARLQVLTLARYRHLSKVLVSFNVHRPNIKHLHQPSAHKPSRPTK